MTDWLPTFFSALMGGLIGAWLTYFFGLRKDKEERRRERVVSHLIESYRNLENSALRDSMTAQQMDRLESSIAATFLLGSRRAAEEAKRFALDHADGHGSLTDLLRVMRNDLREELGLEQHQEDAVFLRMRREHGSGNGQ